MFSLIYVWMNGWINNHEAGDLRRNRAHYDVTVMLCHLGVLLTHPYDIISIQSRTDELLTLPYNMSSISYHTGQLLIHPFDISSKLFCTDELLSHPYEIVHRGEICTDTFMSPFTVGLCTAVQRGHYIFFQPYATSSGSLGNSSVWGNMEIMSFGRVRNSSVWHNYRCCLMRKTYFLIHMT